MELIDVLRNYALIIKLQFQMILASHRFGYLLSSFTSLEMQKPG